jgi:hypothetical protein
LVTGKGFIMSALRARTGLLGLVVLASAVTACGGSATKVSVNPGLLTSAYNSTAAAHSSHIEMDVQISTATGTATRVVATGAVQWKPILASLSETIGTGSNSFTLSARLVGTDIYIELPPQYEAQTGGRPWLKASVSALVGKNAINEFDPTQTLALLSGRADSVVKVGTETVGGVEATHYKAVIDLTESTTTPALGQLERNLEAMLDTEELPVDVWIARNGELVQMRMQLTLEKPPAGASSTLAAAYPITEVMTESLSDYGVTVAVSPPPTSEVSAINLAQILQNDGL